VFMLKDIHGQVYPIPEQGMRIGRAAGNDLVLADEEASRYHATVWVHGGQAYIRDENSTNGTWVNERRISAPTPLRPGDRIRVGQTVLEVLGREPGATVVSMPEVAPPPPTASFPSGGAYLPPAAPFPPAAPAGVSPRRRTRSPVLWILAGLGSLLLCGALLLGGLLAAGKDLSAIPFLATPTPTSTPTPTNTPTPTATPTPTPTLTPTPTPTRTPTPTPTPTPCLPDVAFVADVTVPDGAQFAPGASFTKIWRVRSSGCRAWEPGSRWTFVSGDQLGAPGGVDVSPARPGETVDISVPMRAPTAPGTYKGFWQMRGPDGRFFGDRVYVQIVVAQPTPTPDTRPRVTVTIINDTGGTLTLSLSGPASYRFTFSPGRHTIQVVPGTYSYTAWGCGGASTSGTHDLSEGDEWRFWCR
jgi:hypothetical protein